MIKFEMMATRSPHPYVNRVLAMTRVVCKALNFTHYFTWSDDKTFNLYVGIEERSYKIQCRCEHLGDDTHLGHWYIQSEAANHSMTAGKDEAVAVAIITPIVMLECKRAFRILEDAETP